MTFTLLRGRRRRGVRAIVAHDEAATILLASAHRNALLHEYADGLAHGMRMTLTLLLGERTDGGEPFSGPLPPDVEQWARAALARVNVEAPR